MMGLELGGSRFMCRVRRFSSMWWEGGETSRTAGSESRKAKADLVGERMPWSRLLTERVCPAGRGNWSGEGERVRSVRVGVDLPDRREGMVEEGGGGDEDVEGAVLDVGQATTVDDESKEWSFERRREQRSGLGTRVRGECYYAAVE